MLNQQKQYNQTLHSFETNEYVTTTKLHIKNSLLECMHDFIWKTNVHMRARDNENAKKKKR